MSRRQGALDVVIFGVDVQSGDIRGDAPSFALAALDVRRGEAFGGGQNATRSEDGETVSRDVVTYRKLRRRIAGERPAIVATDNVFELAADKDALEQLLRELPDETALVQVTGAERPEPLSRVAARHGVPYGKEPMREAEAAARLAAKNVGHEVTAFTDTTRVKISRGRSTGKGGWSQDRYTRRIHGSVRTRAREVEAALDEAGLEYEREVTEKYGGYANAVFTVAARPGEIPVSRERSGDVRVEIEREGCDGIEFEPLAKRRDFVVVGIDPGTTTAVAIVDIGGEVLDVLSTRTADTAAVIEWIIAHGRPFLVAADVTPMPETVEKIRRSFDAAAWIPERDLLVDQKQHRTREQGYDNDHERDAMAAALFAVDAHEDQFARIARKVPAHVDSAAVTSRVVAGDESVESVLADFLEEERESEPEPEQVQREWTPEERRIAELSKRVERLEGHASDLQETIAERDERIEELEGELRSARDRERSEVRERRTVNRLERENDRLQRENQSLREDYESLEGKLDRLKELWRLDHSNFVDVEPERRGLVAVKPVEKFTVGAIEAAEASYGLAKGDVVLLRDASGAGRRTAERLVATEPRVVLKRGGISEVADEVLFEHEVPVGDAEAVEIQEVDELAVARERDVDAVVERWEERAAERRRDQKAEMVDRLISEHRTETSEGD